jgi:hypothetical protein
MYFLYLVVVLYFIYEFWKLWLKNRRD